MPKKQEHLQLCHFQDRVKEGFLTKYGGAGITANWKRRWFVLLPEGLIYYFKDTKPTTTPKEVINLAYYDTVEGDDSRPLCMRMYHKTNPVRVYKMYADTKEELEGWMETLQDSLNAVNRKNSHGSLVLEPRLFRLLHLGVIEAKDFVSHPVDCYCISKVGLGSQRTTLQWSTNHPIWNQEFDFEMGKGGHMEDRATVTVWSFGGDHQDQLLGKVNVNLCPLPLKKASAWYEMDSASLQTYVSGDIRLRMKYSGTSDGGSLKVTVCEARNLVAKDANGFSDPYCRLGCSMGKARYKTAVRKKTLNPVYNEEYEFEVSSINDTLVVSLFDHDIMGSDDFLGLAKVPLSAFNAGEEIDRWYELGSISDEDEDQAGLTRGSVSSQNPHNAKPKCGKVRISVHAEEHVILPTYVYGNLLDLIMGGDLGLASAISQVVADRLTVARSLVRVFTVQRRAVDLLHKLVRDEVSSTTSTGVLFRANSFSTKAIEHYQQLVGLPYLQSVLKDVVQEIAHSTKSTEVDPQRLPKGASIEHNLEHLKLVVQSVVERIFTSVDRCPKSLRMVYSQIQRSVTAAFPDDDTVKVTGVSGFVFLRFFVVALYSPKAMGLLDENPGQIGERTLTLVAKTIQNLANMVEFGMKEEWMSGMNHFIRGNMGNMKLFITSLTTSVKEEAAASMFEKWDDGAPASSIFFEKEVAQLHSHLSLCKNEVAKVIGEGTEAATTLLKEVDEISAKAEEASASWNKC